MPPFNWATAYAGPAIHPPQPGGGQITPGGYMGGGDPTGTAQPRTQPGRIDTARAMQAFYEPNYFGPATSTYDAPSWVAAYGEGTPLSEVYSTPGQYWAARQQGQTPTPQAPPATIGGFQYGAGNEPWMATGQLSQAEFDLRNQSRDDYWRTRTEAETPGVGRALEGYGVGQLQNYGVGAVQNYGVGALRDPRRMR